MTSRFGSRNCQRPPSSRLSLNDRRRQGCRTGGRSITAVARDLGLTETAVRRWVAQAEVDAGHRDGLTTAEREELSRLRKENRVLREERDVLKRATVFFAAETR